MSGLLKRLVGVTRVQLEVASEFTESELRVVLAGQHGDQRVRAIMQVIQTETMDRLTASIDPEVPDKLNRHEAGAAAGLSELIALLRELLDSPKAKKEAEDEGEE